MSGTGSSAEYGIKLFVGKFGKVQPCHFYELCKFAGSDGNIDIVHTVNLVLFSGTFEFLCGTGHNADNNHVCRIDSVLFRVIALHQRTVHSLRRLCGGQIGNKFREIVLTVLDPSGGAGGNKREGSVFLETVDEFRSFLHDGDICGYIDVHHGVKAQTAHSGNHLALNICSYRHTELFAETGTDGGGGSYYDVLPGVRKSLHYRRGIVSFNKSSGGTVDNALSAGDAGGILKLHVEGTAYICGKTSFVGTDNAHALKGTAYGGTAAAEDTFIVVSYKIRVAGLHLILRFIPVEFGFILYSVFLAESLKLAVRASGT